MFARVTPYAFTVIQFLAGMLAVLPQDDVVVSVVVDGLQNPTSVVCQPSTGIPFVSESAAGNVIRVVNEKPEPVITGFPTEIFSSQPGFRIGPLGLHFLSNSLLVVGEGGSGAGADALALYELPSDAKPISYKGSMQSLNLPAHEETPAEGNFYSIASNSKNVFVTCHGDDRQGWIAAAVLDADYKMSNLKRKIATASYAKTQSPTCVVLSDDNQIYAGLQGELSVRYDSVVAVFDQNGSPIGKFKTGLSDIVDLEFAPESGRLFALDFSAMDPEEAGLYELTDISLEKESCKLKRVIHLAHPTSMSIGSNGELYVVQLGAWDEGGSTPKSTGGSLLRLTGWQRQ